MKRYNANFGDPTSKGSPMTFRFHHSIKLMPGLRVNLSKGGISTSIGVRGAWFTIGAKGTRATLGVPGTGLSYSTYRPHKKQDLESHQDTPAVLNDPTMSAAIAPPGTATDHPAPKTGMSSGISPGTKTALMAFGAFVIVFVVFSRPAPPPDHPVVYNTYTGCELRGAIKRCDEFAKAVANGWKASYGVPPIPQIHGAPSVDDQIAALGGQDDWLRRTQRDEEQVARQEHAQKIYRQDYERRGVKF